MSDKKLSGTSAAASLVAAPYSDSTLTCSENIVLGSIFWSPPDNRVLPS